jgi:NRAMP (natural resistance-associated macrophage protein)-like metal ion transporter
MGTAIALQILFGLKLWIGVFLTIFTTFLILAVKYLGMRKLEILFSVLIGTMALCFFINLGFISPNYLDILEGLFIPMVPAKAKMAMVGLIGAVIMPHNLFLHSSLIHEKRIDPNNNIEIKKSLKYFYIETGLSLFISFLISTAVISTFAFYSDD